MSLDGQKPAQAGTRPDRAAAAIAEIEVHAEGASSLLKAMSHEGRLMILINLSAGELSVGDIEQRVGLRQAAVSQQLARLRSEGLVQSRRSGKTIHYSIRDPRVGRILALIHEIFRTPD